MWMIFNSDGSFSHSMNIKPNPIDLENKQVVETSDELDFSTKRYSLVEGKIVSEDFVFEPPPPAQPPTVQEKLEKSGLTIEELKEALGLN